MAGPMEWADRWPRSMRSNWIAGWISHLSSQASATSSLSSVSGLTCTCFRSTKAQYTPDSLRSRFGRWLNETEEGKVLCKRWKDWVGGMVKKYDWDIELDEANHPTIHGLRRTGILARAEVIRED